MAGTAAVNQWAGPCGSRQGHGRWTRAGFRGRNCSRSWRSGVWPHVGRLAAMRTRARPGSPVRAGVKY
eukprot:3388710-Rhodomonas_salina.2